MPRVTASMSVYQTNSAGVEPFSYVNTFFSSNKFAWLLFHPCRVVFKYIWLVFFFVCSGYLYLLLWLLWSAPCCRSAKTKNLINMSRNSVSNFSSFLCFEMKVGVFNTKPPAILCVGKIKLHSSQGFLFSSFLPERHGSFSSRFVA